MVIRVCYASLATHHRIASIFQGCGIDASTEWYWEFYVRFCDECRETRSVLSDTSVTVVRHCLTYAHTHRLIGDPRREARLSEKRQLIVDIPTNMFNMVRLEALLPIIINADVHDPQRRISGRFYDDVREVYLDSEVEHLMNAWQKLVQDDDEEQMATFIGKQIMRVRKTAKVLSSLYAAL